MNPTMLKCKGIESVEVSSVEKWGTKLPVLTVDGKLADLLPFERG